MSQLSWKSLKACYSIRAATFVFKCINGIGQDLFLDYFTKLSHSYNTRRNSLDLILPKVKTESAKKSCFYSGAVIYNHLPTYILRKLPRCWFLNLNGRQQNPPTEQIVYKRIKLESCEWLVHLKVAVLEMANTIQQNLDVLEQQTGGTLLHTLSLV